MAWAVVRDFFFNPVVLHTTDSENKARRWLKAKRKDEVDAMKLQGDTKAVAWTRKRQRIAYRVVEVKDQF